MLAQTAERSPDRLAVVSPTGNWTWSELRDAAGVVTARLRDLGVGAGDRVGILADRSREMLAGLVGIMGAGATYVPLDPSYPVPRIRYMVEHSGASAILTHRGLETGFEFGIPVVDLDEESHFVPGEFTSVDPESAAYVIYTSGSTGTPKGVEVPHRAVANFLHAMAERPGLGPEDHLLAVTTVSFDISVLELYLPLLTGARLVIADEKDSRDGRRLAEVIVEEEITVMQATPATWKLLVSAGWNGAPDLRVLCGGEGLPPSLAEELLARTAEVWNMYGPTETTVWSTVQKIESGSPILIGRPIDNTRVYVLDEAQRLLPIGVPGELWIAGDGVAIGYFQQPDLTAERFVPSPFREGERMYRTGDLARWRPDGSLEHLGRLDHQVKVRGFRIELGEVEAALREHSGVRDVVVVARDDRLVAYPILTLDAPSPGDLRRWLADRLPPYMVPSVFVPVREFPLTPNGKVDRKALPDPGWHAADTSRHEPPVGEHEIAVARVWEELLQVPGVGRTDNFFELGGHSLLAMEAVAIMEERIGHQVDPRSLFFRSLAEIASAIPASTDS
jgi:amino acid adenylation domain-containing protein